MQEHYDCIKLNLDKWKENFQMYEKTTNENNNEYNNDACDNHEFLEMLLVNV